MRHDDSEHGLTRGFSPSMTGCFSRIRRRRNPCHPQFLSAENHILEKIAKCTPGYIANSVDFISWDWLARRDFFAWPYVDNWGLFLSANNAEPDFFEKWNYRLLSHHHAIFADWWWEPAVLLTVSQLVWLRFGVHFPRCKSQYYNTIADTVTYSVRQLCISLHSIEPKTYA